MTREVIVVNLIFKEFALVGWHGVSGEQSGHMLREAIVDFDVILKELLVLLIVVDWYRIIMLLCDVIMI